MTVPPSDPDKAAAFLRHLIATEYVHLRRLRNGTAELGCGLTSDGVPGWLRAQWVTQTEKAITRMERDLAQLRANRSTR